MNELRIYKYQPSFYFIHKKTFPIDDLLSYNHTTRKNQENVFYIVNLIKKKLRKKNKRFTI